MKPEIDGVGIRLVKALNRRDKSLRALHMALQRKQVPGSSYPNMVQIRHGKSEPSLGFLAAAAEELRVPPAWLAFGLGSMTDSDAIADSSTGRYPSGKQALLGARIERLLEKAAPTERTAAVVTAFVNAFSRDADDRIWLSVSRAWLALTSRFGGGAKSDLKAARLLGSALRAPLDRIGVDPSDLSPWQQAHCATLVSAALEVALAEPHMLKPITAKKHAAKT